MAIGKYSAVPPPPEIAQAQPLAAPPTTTTTAAATATAQDDSAPSQPHHGHTASGTIDIEAWTLSALQSLSVSPAATGTGGQPLSIPLDEHSRLAQHSTSRVTIALNEGDLGAITPPRRPPSRRDSMKRREALLKGKEGSRQRRRWDMARLTDVPNVEPPLASDWEPRPVYPIQHIPYHVAQYWDRGLRQQVEEKKNAAARTQHKFGANTQGKVPRDLRETIKKTPGVKSWVRALEEPVRQFLVERGGATEAASQREQSPDDESDFSDEEIVFVGRKKAVQEPLGWKRAHREVREQQIDRGMVFDSLEDDESGAFKRWLTHSISDYYGLDSRSVTMGNPARRCVYIGIRDVDLRKGSKTRVELPRPLWELF